MCGPPGVAEITPLRVGRPGPRRRNLGGAIGVDTSQRARGDGISVDPDDGEVLARIRAGDADAYAALVRRHAPVAVRAAALLGAGPDAEDVVQEAFVKAYAALGRFREGAAFRPWLLRIVANETANLHRSAGRRRAREQVAWLQAKPLLLAGSDDPAAAALTRERSEELVHALAGLSDDQRRVVTFRYLLDLDEAETAAALGWPRGTVKSRLHRALARLSQQLAAPTAVEVPDA